MELIARRKFSVEDARPMASGTSVRSGVFISYSHEDKEWLDRVQVHLKPLERDHAISVWSDKQIQAGSRWRQEIERALQKTRIAVLLISADFLASDFIANDEL